MAAQPGQKSELLATQGPAELAGRHEWLVCSRSDRPRSANSGHSSAFHPLPPVGKTSQSSTQRVTHVTAPSYCRHTLIHFVRSRSDGAVRSWSTAVTGVLSAVFCQCERPTSVLREQLHDTVSVVSFSGRFVGLVSWIRWLGRCGRCPDQERDRAVRQDRESCECGSFLVNLCRSYSSCHL